MPKLSTHVLDTANGRPAAGMSLVFVRDPGDHESVLKTLETNSDGRTDELLLTESEMQVGEYEIRFDVAGYFQNKGAEGSDTAFLNIVPIRFSIVDAGENYHVPLLCSPWSFSTYRGS